MNDMQTLKPYKTIFTDSEAEQVINKSRFIGRAFHVENDEEAAANIAAIKKRHYDATHNCYAYIIDANRARYSDDGEPQGTAGMPIMEVIRARALSYTLCVVTRYFGGILLGAGGLVRAYSGSAAMCLDSAGVSVAVVGLELHIVLSYSQYAAMEMFIKRETVVRDIVFLENVVVTCQINKNLADAFIKSIAEQSCGKVIPTIVNEVIMLSKEQ